MVGDGGKVLVVKMKSGKRDAYAFDLDELKLVMKVVVVWKCVKVMIVIVK